MVTACCLVVVGLWLEFLDSGLLVVMHTHVIVTLRLFTYPKKRDRFVRFMPLAQAFSRTQRRDLNPVPVPPL